MSKKPVGLYTRVMFHATHVDNVQNIYDVGLSPEFCQSNFKAIWFTPKNGIQSGILHACARHHWRVDDVVVIAVLVESEHIKYSGNSNLFYSKHIAVAQSDAPALSYLDEPVTD